MKTLDLSRIKVVGFIPNFNPKCGYPEFAYNGADTSISGVSPKYDFSSLPLKEKMHKPQARHIKNAKRAFKKRNPNHIPKTMVLDYKLESSADIAWRTN